MATSASPACRSSTLSVPITSRGALGRSFLQAGSRGTSQRLAKAFVVVTRRGCWSPSRLTAAIAVANASRPSRMAGKRRAPASVSDSGRGLRRNRAPPAIALQQSDLMADRRRRHAELGRGLLEAQMPRRGVKGAQLDEGRQLLHAGSVDEIRSSSAEFFAFAPGTVRARRRHGSQIQESTPCHRSHPLPNAAAELAAIFSGQLLKPADAGYEEARKVHNGLVDKRPALIARCRGVADVVDAVDLARKLGLEVAVRGGGHNVAGRATIDGGVMIDLSPMKGIHVDPKSRTVRAQGGVTWGELNRETQLHGLAVTGGVVSSTGIAGLTLGGGLGWLMGKYGLALDNLRSVELVTADGKVVRASKDEEPDLFWAVRGGGGNFGVATSLRISAAPGGPHRHRRPDRPPVRTRPRSARVLPRQHGRSLPDEHTLFATLTHAPDGSGTKVAGTGDLPLRLAGRRRKSDAAAEAIRVSRSWMRSVRCPTASSTACSMPPIPRARSTTGSRASSRS